jgi:flagella basal body P-ring formation protein FlgA
LGDVADLRGDDPQAVTQLAQLPLMPTPESQYVRAQTIRDLLTAHGYDASQIQFAGAEQVLITCQHDTPAAVADTGLNRPQTGFRQITPNKSQRPRPPQPVSAARLDELRIQLAEQIIEHLRSASDEARPWRVAFSLERRRAERLQQAVSPLEVAGGEAPWLGPQRFLVSFSTAGGDVRFPVDAVVSEAPLVVIAKRALQRGDTLTAADIELLPLPERAKLPAQKAAATNVEELLGHEVIGPIRPGEVVTTDMFAPPMLVRRGDTVTVHAGGGGIQIRVLANARVDGRRGEIIEVETPETKERYTARVVGPRQLAVLSIGAAYAEQTAQHQTHQSP